VGWGGSREECGRVVEAFAQAGGNFIDTADKYTEGTAERYVGELVAPERDRWVLATKYTLRATHPTPTARATTARASSTRSTRA
jgi:aryl-alcohol dehydrogenase-like predicted oxidoreductase